MKGGEWRLRRKDALFCFPLTYFFFNRILIDKHCYAYCSVSGPGACPGPPDDFLYQQRNWRSKDVNAESIYLDYAVWGTEEGGEMTTKLQFRFAGPNGTTMVLDKPAQVELDGTVVPVDSSRMLGAYYERIQPVQSLAGHHTIRFTDPSGKSFSEEFDFQPFFAENGDTGSFGTGRSSTGTGGLAPVDYLHIMLNDTSSMGRSIDRYDTVRGGQILITRSNSTAFNPDRSAWRSTAMMKGSWKPTVEGGKLSISYGLRREFQLK